MISASLENKKNFFEIIGKSNSVKRTIFTQELVVGKVMDLAAFFSTIMQR